MLRAAITQGQHTALRVLAAQKGIPASELVAQALRSSPVTRKAFQTKETK